MKVQTYAPGTLIANRYQIAVPVGAGGMGVVYYAFDHGQDGLPIALKTFHPQLLSDRGARDSFLQEGRGWLELGRHPHIVEAYAIDRVEGRGEVFIAAELISPVEGKRNASLRHWVQQGGLPWEQAFLFGLQIVWGMQHAVSVHPGLVHRDLKPENVLVGADKVEELDVYRVRVTDFGLVAGLAKADFAQGEADIEEKLIPGRSVHVAGIAGTPAYMAPEQWLGEGLDERTDIYAWGLILAEILSGKMVVAGETASDIKQQHLAGVTSSVPEQAPAEWRSLLEQCAAREKAERPVGWEALERELRAVWQAQKEESLPEGGWRIAEDVTVSRKRMMRANNTIGISYLDISRYEDALVPLEKSLVIARELGDRAGEGHALGNLGNVYQSTGRYESALAHYEQHLAIVRELGDRAGEGMSLAHLGNVYQSTGQYERALVHLQKSLIIARDLGDRAGEGVTLGNLGNAYLATGQYQRALIHHEQALEIARELGDRAIEGSILSNMGIVYRRISQNERALEYSEKSLSIFRELGDRAGEGKALGNLGIVYAETGQFERALAHYERYAAIARELDDTSGSAFISLTLAALVAETGDLPTALAHALEAQRIFEQIGQLQFAQNAEELIAKIEQDLRQQ